MGLGLPYTSAPAGWFQIAWSDDIVAEDVRPLRYFGRDMVCYRGDDGQIRVFDAFCPHLGAHLGYGGTVAGNDIVCPFHGWRWGCDGKNVDIPYESRPNRGKRLSAWPVREVNGWVMVWYHPDGAEPQWEAPVIDEFVSGELITGPEFRQFDASIRLQPQFIVENIVDAAHQVDVHGGTEPLDIVDYAPDGPVFRVHTRLVLGAGKKSTWLTPEGKTVADLFMESWGMGIAIARHMQDRSIHAQNSTPIDDEHSALFATLLLVPPADEAAHARAERRFRFEMKQLGHDIEIWKHMRYEPHPPFAGMEPKPYGAFRSWAAQFYTAAEVSA